MEEDARRNQMNNKGNELILANRRVQSEGRRDDIGHWRYRVNYDDKGKCSLTLMYEILAEIAA